MTEHRSPQAETSQPPMPPRQTAAYLKKWFAEVGFTIDARRGQNFLIDLNLLDLLIRSAAIGPDDAAQLSFVNGEVEFIKGAKTIEFHRHVL